VLLSPLFQLATRAGEQGTARRWKLLETAQVGCSGMAVLYIEQKMNLLVLK